MAERKIYTIVKELEVAPVEQKPGVITIQGYANKYSDGTGKPIEDRSGESMPPSAFRLDNYKKNPVLLYQHKSDEPVGKVVDVQIRPDGLWIQAEVYEKLNPKVFAAVELGVLKALSVGFRAFDYKEVDGLWVWTDVELFEISIVSVPDNQDSLFSVDVLTSCTGDDCYLAGKAAQFITKDANAGQGDGNSVPVEGQDGANDGMGEGQDSGNGGVDEGQDEGNMPQNSGVEPKDFTQFDGDAEDNQKDGQQNTEETIYSTEAVSAHFDEVAQVLYQMAQDPAKVGDLLEFYDQLGQELNNTLTQNL